jgi:hypothetical protein
LAVPGPNCLITRTAFQAGDMTSVFFDPALTDHERRNLLYNGQLFVLTAPVAAIEAP